MGISKGSDDGAETDSETNKESGEGRGGGGTASGTKTGGGSSLTGSSIWLNPTVMSVAILCYLRRMSIRT
eukprot:319313-Hanusia_phi.AAC.1